MLYAFFISMVDVSNACLKLAWWHGWEIYLISSLRTYFLACFLAYLLDSGLAHLITACLLQFWLAQLNLDYGFDLCYCNSAGSA
jgi:hypothetical protein